MARKPVVLVTGGTGVLGRALIDELSADFSLVCLRHHSPVDDSRVRDLSGSDMLRPDLGLDRATGRELRREVDLVLHSAAMTNWSKPGPEIRAVNLVGTTNLLAFAAAAGATFYHVSTAFVARPPDVDPEHRAEGAAAYIESKIESEELVRGSGLDTVILRPSVLSGHSRTGHIPNYQGLHTMMGGIMRGTVPIIPADPSALIDCLPQDVAARAIGLLLRQGVRAGEYWLTAGEQAMRLQAAVDICSEVARAAGLSPAPPRLMSAEAVSRLLIPLMEGFIDPRLRRKFTSFIELMLVFQATVALPTSLPELGLSGECRREALTAAFGRSAQSWAAAHHLMAHAPVEVVSE